MANKSFEKWAKEYKWQKRRKAISEFFGKCLAYFLVYSIIPLIVIPMLIWVGVYVWYLAPYTRAFCFDYLGLYAFPAVFHAVPMFGIPILIGAFSKAIYNIVKNRSTTRPEYLKKNN